VGDAMQDYGSFTFKKVFRNEDSFSQPEFPPAQQHQDASSLPAKTLDV